MYFVLKFQCFELILIFFKKLCFSSKFGEPQPISIDPFCFQSIELVSNCFYRVSVCFDRSRLFFDQSKLVKQVFKKKTDWTFSNSFQLFSLSALAIGSTIKFFVVFLQDFC